MNDSISSQITFLNGIRGLAILLVIFYHAGFIKFGYVGVDIFFILSGFLITMIIYKETIKNKFSFIEFYKNRVLRIFPMALLVISLSIFIGYFVLFYNEFQELLNYMHYALTLRANNLAMNNVDYFDLGANFKPLIHFWSLSIELQFYIAVPFLLHFFINKKMHKELIFTLSLFISISLFYLFFHINFPTIYYSSIGRIYQFLFGSLLSIILFHYRTKLDFIETISNKKLTVINSLLLALLFYIIFIDTKLVFILKSFSVSVLFIIFIGMNFLKENKLVSLLFSNKPIVYIGMISYSLYLIHYPIFAFSRILYDRYLNFNETIILLLLVTIISTITYFYIEKPIMNKNSSNQFKRQIFFSMILVISFLYYFGSIAGEKIIIKDQTVQQYLNYSRDNHPDLTKSRIDSLVDLKKIYTYPANNQNNNISKKNIAFWGDSHMNQISAPLAEKLNNRGLNVLEFSVAGCPPIINTESADNRRTCNQNSKIILNYLINNKDIDTVVLYAYWHYYFQEGALLFPSNNATSYNSALSQNINKTVSTLKKYKKNVYIIYPTPVMKHNIPLYIARSIKIFKNDHPSESCLNEREYKDQVANIEVLFNNINDIHKVNISQYLKKNNNYCSTSGNEIYYRDDNHLSLTFSKRFSKDISEQIMPNRKKNEYL
jgi:peptidoglycan/LPS O-acetylase OafA/YrhL